MTAVINRGSTVVVVATVVLIATVAAVLITVLIATVSGSTNSCAQWYCIGSTCGSSNSSGNSSSSMSNRYSSSNNSNCENGSDNSSSVCQWYTELSLYADIIYTQAQCLWD